MKKTICRLTLAILIFSGASLAAVEVPQLKGYVNDYAGILSSSEKQQIAQILSNIDQTTSAQGALLIIDSLEGESIESFSIKTADEWKLGQEELDNGFLIVLSMEEKKIRIEVGYGLEGEMTDAKSGYIIREIIVPEFRKGNFANGLYQGTVAVGGVISSTADITAGQISSSNRTQRRSRSGIPINFVIFIIIFFISSISRRGRRGGGGLFQALFLGSLLGSASRRHSGFGGGSFGGGSFGGGGFSGGGGGFGGGGASGGW